MAYNGRNAHGKSGLALAEHDQTKMIDIIGMSFTPMYKVVRPFLFFMFLQLMFWIGFCLMWQCV
jgi:hypothetical protein